MSNAHAIRLVRFTDDQALAWLATRSPCTISCAALAKQFGWHRNTLGAKLQSWASTGQIQRQGKTIVVPKKVHSTMLHNAAQVHKCAEGGRSFAAILLGILLIFIAVFLACALVYINARAWAAFARASDDQWVFVSLAIVIDVLAALLPLCSRFMGFWSALGMWCMWCACMGMILWTSVGFAFGNFGDSAGARGASIDRRAVVQSDVARFRKELAALPPFAVTTQAQADAAVEERRRECDNGRFCTRARSKEAATLAASALTTRQRELSDALERLESELKVLPVIASADPQLAGALEAIKKLAGYRVDLDNASAWRDVIFAFVFSFFPGQLLRWGHGSLVRD